MNDTLEGLAVINFPESIGLDEFQDLLRNLSESSEGNYSFHGGFTGVWSYKKDDEESYITSMNGFAKDFSTSTITAFELIRDEQKLEGYFSELRFFTAPGYDLEEIPKNERDLWASLTRDINNYFSEKQTDDSNTLKKSHEPMGGRGPVA